MRPLHRFVRTALFAAVLATSTHAIAHETTVVVNGTIFATAAGTSVDWWEIEMEQAGTLTVDVLAYESTDNTPANGQDLNGDGEITFLDPDTSLYQIDGVLDASDYLLRCDDVGNSNGVCSATLGSGDGSIHTRDPIFSIDLQPGRYLYIVGDYRTTIDEGIARLNAGDSIRNGGDHGDYRITFESTGHMSVAAVPEPATNALLAAGVLLLGSVVARRKSASA